MTNSFKRRALVKTTLLTLIHSGNIYAGNNSSGEHVADGTGIHNRNNLYAGGAIGRQIVKNRNTGNNASGVFRQATTLGGLGGGTNFKFGVSGTVFGTC